MGKADKSKKTKEVTADHLLKISEVLGTTWKNLTSLAAKLEKEKESLDNDPFLAETKTLEKYAFDCHRFATNLENKWNLREFEKSVGQIKSSMELLDKLSSQDTEEDDE